MLLNINKFCICLLQKTCFASSLLQMNVLDIAFEFHVVWNSEILELYLPQQK